MALIIGGNVQITGNITVTNESGVPSTVEYLVVAGGGGGGSYSIIDYGGPGGGGGGGLLLGSVVFEAGVTYTIAIGSGGGGGWSEYSVNGSQGGNTTIVGNSLSLTTYGGGYGGRGLGGDSYAGGDGGSGGGSGSQRPFVRPGGYGVYPGSPYIDAPRQGYDGSAASHPVGGGGGGAGEERNRTVFNSNGANGVYSTISGTNIAYAGGGAGYNGGTAGTGGGGGANTGGGGNGGAAPAGNGGSGVVILRYPDNFIPATTTGSPTYNITGGYRIYTFTGSGTFRIG